MTTVGDSLLDHRSASGVHLYDLHGLTLALPFACDELVPAPAGSHADATVVEGSVPETLADAGVRDADFDAAADAFLLRGGRRSARFLVTGGTTITYQRGAACEEPLLRHLLLYQAMAALLRQRGLLVLHASAALSPDGAVIVAGQSGAGKSTTVAALTARGWPLQTDDICALRPAPGGGVEVMPGATNIHLFAEAAVAVDLPIAGLVRHDWHRMKMAVPATTDTVRRPAPVRRIVLLRTAPNGPVTTRRLVGRAKLALLDAAYGPLLPAQVATVEPILSRGLRDVDLLAVTRPQGDWTMDAVLAAIGAEQPCERHEGTAASAEACNRIHDKAT